MKSTPRRIRRAKGGFSVIEMLIVVLIIGILATLAGLSVRRYQRSVEADNTATFLAQLIRGLREDALSERSTYRLVLRSGTAVPGSRGDQYQVERWTYDITTGNGVEDTRYRQAYTLPKGWRFAKPAGSSDPRGLRDLFAGPTVYMIFKGDGTIRDGSSSAVVANPTIYAGTRPVNGTVFITDTEEPDTGVRKYKPRAITVLGATGRTAIWKLFDTEWRIGGQKS